MNLLPGAPMPDENPTTDFFLFLKKKGFTKPTLKEAILVKDPAPMVKDLPYSMRSHWMHTPKSHIPSKYSFKIDSPSMTPVNLQSEQTSTRSLVFTQILLFVILASCGTGLYVVYKHIKELTNSKTAIPRNVVILRDVLIGAASLVGFALIVSFFF